MQMGVDLGLWWSQGRYRALLDMLDQRPSASRLSEAIYTDPSNAQVLLDERRRMSKRHRRWSPRISEYNLQAELTAMLINDVRSIFGNARQWELVPGPESAADALERHEQELDALAIIAVATPQYADAVREALHPMT